MKPTGRSRTWAVMLLVIPTVILLALLVAEDFLMRDSGTYPTLDGTIPEPLKKVLDFNQELAKLFITTALAIIGGAAYYLKRHQTAAERTNRERDALTPVAKCAAVVIFVAAGLSVYFGHLWTVAMRNQLAADYFIPTAWALEWTERLQFGLLIVSVAAFAVMTAERTAGTVDKPPPAPKKWLVRLEDDALVASEVLDDVDKS